MTMPSYSLFVNGAWETLPKGTWVEIENGLGDFSGARGTITHGPYGYSKRDINNRHFPPMYNLLVTKPHREKAIGVNFEAHKLRKLTTSEIASEKKVRQALPLMEQTNSFSTDRNGVVTPNLQPSL